MRFSEESSYLLRLINGGFTLAEAFSLIGDDVPFSQRIQVCGDAKFLFKLRILSENGWTASELKCLTLETPEEWANRVEFAFMHLFNAFKEVRGRIMSAFPVPTQHRKWEASCPTYM